MESCGTTIQENLFRFQWTIRSFSSVLEDNNCTIISSAKFSMRGETPGQWQLDIYPHGAKDETRSHLAIFLIFSATPSYKVQMLHSLQITIKSSGNNDHGFLDINHLFSEEMSDWGWLKFISIEELKARASDLLPNDAITVVAEGKYDLMMTISPDSFIKIDPPSFADDLQLLLNKMDKDVKLISEGKTIPAHKLIICARSPVFEAMFRHNTTENISGLIVISDISYKVLQEVVTYMYTDKEPPNIASLAEDILIAADKYDLPRLKTMCERHLADKVDTNNVISILAFASVHNAPQLKNMCLEYVSQQKEQLKDRCSC